MEHILLYVHIGFLCLAGCGIVIGDHAALQWFLGRDERVDERAAHLAHWIVSIAITGIIFTGLLLFWPIRSYALTQPLFWLKMAFVAALVVNSFVIESLTRTATKQPFASLSRNKRSAFIASGLVSTISWIGAACVAIIIF